jgi:hypothetical protein
MIDVPTNPLTHYAFDALAWFGAAVAARRWPEETLRPSPAV